MGPPIIRLSDPDCCLGSCGFCFRNEHSLNIPVLRLQTLDAGPESLTMDMCTHLHKTALAPMESQNYGIAYRMNHTGLTIEFHASPDCQGFPYLGRLMRQVYRKVGDVLDRGKGD
jgi:hypothetical protein